MMRKIIDFIPAAVGMDAFNWQIDLRGKAGGPGITGAGQVVYGTLPRWVAELGFNAATRDRVLVQRSLIAQVRGRVNVLRIRIEDPLRPTWRELGTTDYNGGPLPHGDSALFADGAGYLQGMTAPILAAAPAGATSILIDAGYLGDAISGGQMFSIDDWLYQAVLLEGEGANAVLHFEMPLRRSVGMGQEINFDPWALMTLEEDLAGGTTLDLNLTSRPSLRLVEWVGPGR